MFTFQVFLPQDGMKYCSTRGKVRDLSFEDVLFSGFLGDGGMALPETIPRVPPDTLRSWAGLPYRDLVLKIVPLFVSEGELPLSVFRGEHSSPSNTCEFYPYCASFYYDSFKFYFAEMYCMNLVVV